MSEVVMKARKNGDANAPGPRLIQLAVQLRERVEKA